MSGSWVGVSSPASATPPVDVLKAGRKNITPRRLRDRRGDCEVVKPKNDDTWRPTRRIAPTAGWVVSP